VTADKFTPVLVSVILPLYNGADLLADQLEGLTRQDYSGEWELIVADNGSTDGGPDLAREWSDRLPNLRILDVSARRGGAAAMNLAAPAAKGDVVVFCDHDDVASPSWLSTITDALEKADMAVGCFDYAALNPTSSGPMSTRVFPAQSAYGYLPYGLSANMAVRLPVFEALEGFDETLTTAYDLDLCWRLQLAGYKLATAQAVVAKRRRTALAGAWRQHLMYGRSDVLLYQKHRQHGMPRRISRVLKEYAWLVLQLIPSLVRPERRAVWVRVAGKHCGRLAASLKLRILYP
jgi:glycosyltransferase involved in cell wall biosynthesis